MHMAWRVGVRAALVTLAVTGVAQEESIWRPAGDLSVARSGHAASLLADGRVLVTGGEGDGGALSRAEAYDPAADAFRSLPAAMSARRTRHTSTLLHDGRVLLCGGEDGGGSVASAEVFEPADETFRALLPMATPRAGHVAVRLADGRVLVAGGERPGGALDAMELFDPARDRFASAPALAVARTDAAGVLLLDGRVLIVGGWDGSEALASTEIVDPRTGHADVGPALSTRRRGCTATVLDDGRVLVAGGRDGAGELASAEAYLPAEGRFVPVPSGLAVGRVFPLAIPLPHNGGVVFVGGAPSAAAEWFLPSTGEFRAFGSLAAARDRAVGFAFGADGKILVAGGSGLATSEAARFATLRTDQADYAPGDTARIAGRGFAPGEPVELVVQHADGTRDEGEDHEPWDVAADSDGAFQTSWHVCEDDCLGSRLAVTATGRDSGSIARALFTDGPATDWTTVAVDQVGPRRAPPGARRVPILAFTIRLDSSAPEPDQFKSVKVRFTGTNRVRDLAGMFLYRETNGTAGFQATDELLDGSPVGATEIHFNPARIDVNPGESLMLYVAVDLKPTAPIGDRIDWKVDANKITLASGGWPPASEVGSGAEGTLWNPSGWTVVGFNEAPVAADDAYETIEAECLHEGAPGVLGNDTDADGDELSAELVSGPAHGTLLLGADGSFSYEPAPGFHGLDEFTYRAQDGTTVSGIATVSLIVTEEVAAPLVDAGDLPPNGDGWIAEGGPGEATGDGDGGGVLDPAGAVSDAGGSGFREGGSSDALAAIPAVVSAGSMTDGETMAATTAHGLSGGSAGASGSIAGTGHRSREAHGRLAILGRDDLAEHATFALPAEVVAGFVTDEDTTLHVPAPGILALASDATHARLTLVRGPEHGAVALGTDGSFTFVPALNRHGPETFTVRRSGESDEDRVESFLVLVRPVNDAPLGAGDAFVADEDSVLVVETPGVLANDFELDGEPLAALLVRGPEHGLLTLRADGSFGYLPSPDFSGTDGFTYRASDGVGHSWPVAVTMEVRPGNDGPSALELRLLSTAIFEGGEATLTGKFADADAAEAHSVRIDWGDGGSPQALALAPGIAEFSATRRFLDDASGAGAPVAITVVVADEGGRDARASVSLAILNRAPVITALTGPQGPIAARSAVRVRAAHADAGVVDAPVARIAWGDATDVETIEPGADDGAIFDARHVYRAAGVYPVQVTVADKDGGWTRDTLRYVVVHEPDEAFVAGGGWIGSPSGALLREPRWSGKASFGFVSGRERGTPAPRGTSEFRFDAGSLRFRSRSWSEVAVAGSRARITGSGTIDGQGVYEFLLTAADGQGAGGGGADRFRVRIWDRVRGTVLYDNLRGATCAADDGEGAELGGGDLVIGE